MQFYNPKAFLLFWIIPFMIGLFWATQHRWKTRVSKLGCYETLSSKLMPFYRPSEWRVRLFYLCLVFLFATIALARPQWGEEKKRIERKGVDMIFLLDTSLSMLSEDVKPSRFEKAKLEIKSFVKQLKGDRIGMVAFAGSGFLQAPLTLDYSAFLLFLDAVKIGFIPDPGTSLDQAVRLAIRSFPEQGMKHKAIVLFSDGEDHEGGIEEVLKECQKSGVRIYSIGLGTLKGEPIPLKDENGNRTGFKKDYQGQIVITRLNESLLQQLANETNGLYFPSTPAEEEINLIMKHRESMGQKRFKELLIREKEDHYQLFLFLALVFLVFEMLVKRTHKPSGQILVMLIAFFLFSGFLKGPKELTDEGNELFENKRYQSALEKYRKAQVRKPDDPVIRYNLATALYQTREFQEARKELEKAISITQDPQLKAKALYNYGNTMYRLGDFEKAIEAYEKTLEIDPKDEDAKYNLEFLTKKKSLFDKKDQQKKQSQQQNQQQPQPDQNQKQQQQNQRQQDQEQDQQQQQQDQQQQEDQPSQGQQEQDDQRSSSDQQQDQEEKQDQDRQDQEQPSRGQDKDEQQQPQKEEEQKKRGRYDQDPDQQEQQDQQPEPKEKEQPASQKPLQGQMTKENALRLLDAMKEAERELQDLRRPSTRKNNARVLKDW